MTLSRSTQKLIESRKRQRQKLIKDALRGSSKTYSAAELKAKGPWTYQAFIDDITKVFPSMVNLVRQGRTVTDISRLMGFSSQTMQQFLFRYPELRSVIRLARTRATDHWSLSELAGLNHER